jgi:Ca2+-binding EF-hand superfamily protein
MTMTALMKSSAAGLALVAAIVATAALAQDGQKGGKGDRGAQLIELFDTIDTDADGKVTEAELEAHRAAEFAAADTNADGAISPDELAARELARFTERLPDRTAKMIEARDNDGNGSLSLAEVDEGPVQNRFARIDSDNDGAISKAEAEAAAEKMRQRKGKRGEEN